LSLFAPAKTPAPTDEIELILLFRIVFFHSFPSQERIQETDSRLFSPAPVYPELEKAILAAVMQFASEQLGSDDPFVKALLKSESPEKRADYLFSDSKIVDVEFRKSLIAGGKAGLRNPQNP
jgi:Rps23 Pro-64 3,4-dihydroxylase Tpa1-like proline 4-hydroxylase